MDQQHKYSYLYYFSLSFRRQFIHSQTCSNIKLHLEDNLITNLFKHDSKLQTLASDINQFAYNQMNLIKNFIIVMITNGNHGCHQWTQKLIYPCSIPNGWFLVVQEKSQWQIINKLI